MKSIVIKYDLAQDIRSMDVFACCIPIDREYKNGYTRLVYGETEAENKVVAIYKASEHNNPRRTEKVLLPHIRENDMLFVREWWGYAPASSSDNTAPRIVYRANGDPEPEGGWKEPVSMPEEASRTHLQVLRVVAMYLREITEEEALLSGIQRTSDGYVNYMSPEKALVCNGMQQRIRDWEYPAATYANPKDSYASMWQLHLGSREYPGYAWSTDPLVWKMQLKILPVLPVSHS